MSKLYHSSLGNCASLWIGQNIVLPSLSIFDSSASRDLDSIIGCTVQILFEVVESVAMCFSTNLPRHSPEASHLFPTRSDRILYRNLGHHAVSKNWTDPIDLELPHELHLIENGHISIYAICFSLKNLLYFWDNCSSTLTLLLREVLDMILRNADAILAILPSQNQGSLFAIHLIATRWDRL